ncbi:MAG: iron-sulfur cluster assembly scaffold protein [Chloroflexi bacterium]|nr:iron-sulfur cluster assembly scaffold protein [Chloroflexota bacterium]
MPLPGRAGRRRWARGAGIEGDRIAAASFLTSGCPASIATSSVATELIVGLSLDDAAALPRDAYAEAVGGLPKSKLHCSVLAATAVRQAIASWRERDPAHDTERDTERDTADCVSRAAHARKTEEGAA